MWVNLDYEVTFSNGITKQGKFAFPKGMTVISGENEAGKSLLLEMGLFAMFGQRALRSTGDSYSSIKAKLFFEVEEKTHFVERTKTWADLNNGHVTGTRPVNEAIEELLGFNYQIFSVASACLQGQVSALSDMKPAARKAIVDELVGINRIDSMQKRLSQLVSEAKGRLSALTITDDPKEPVKPCGYLSKAAMDDLVNKGIQEHDEFIKSKAVLDNAISPPEFVPEPNLKNLEKYTYFLHTSAVIAPTTPKIKVNRPANYNPNFDWKTYKKEWEQYRPPEVCPKCGEMLLECFEPEPPLEVVKAYEAYDTYLQHIKARIDYEQRKNARDKLLVLTDKKAAYDLYLNKVKEYTEYQKSLDTHRNTVQKFKGSEKQLKAAKKNRNSYALYDYDLAVYINDKRLFDKYVETKANLEDCKRAREATHSLRKKIKTYLLPSLNAVSSDILFRMTSGSHSELVVDEDFNITVDGNKIETLSGSTLALANIALRISLGRVLINKIFPIFIGDELDAMMDENRARSTFECLKNLDVKQIILVSHKNLPAKSCLTL